MKRQDFAHNANEDMFFTQERMTHTFVLLTHVKAELFIIRVLHLAFHVQVIAHHAHLHWIA